MIYVTQKKLHAKKEEKLLKRFWDRPLPPPLNLDGRTDRQTDKSVLEKLRCLSAGGAKNKEHSINIKNYTAHPHDMVHVPAKCWANIWMRFWVTVRKLNVTDGQTDGGGRCYISRSGPPAAAGDPIYPVSEGELTKFCLYMLEIA